MSLTTRAKELHPNRRNAAKWVQAVKYLRQRNAWIFDPGSRVPSPAPNVQIENVAGRQPALSVYDPGVFAQFKAILRGKIWRTQ